MLVEDVLTIVFERLPVDAICAAACVSRSWAGVGEMDCVWFPRLQRLLRARAFVSDHIRVAFEAWRRSGAGPVPCRELYADAVADAFRTDLRRDEIAAVDEWQFRFKLSAGEGWAAEDPWWQGSSRRILLQLRRDGRVLAISDGRPFWGRPGSVSGRWVAEESEGPTVVSMNGHPSYYVSRHPIHAGLILQSCWCVLSSFPMARRGEDASMEDDALDLSPENDARQAAEAAAYNDRVHVDTGVY